jgi:hypothetical protein
MIRDKQKLEEFERKLLREGNLSYKQALAIYEALLKEAKSLGVINSDNRMEGLEAELKIARAINGLS